MCEVEIKFSRHSVRNHLATHGTTIEDYEKSHGAPAGGQSEIIQPSSVQSQSQPVLSDIASPQGHLVPPTSQLIPPNTGHAITLLHSTLLGPSHQIVQPALLDCGDSVHSVPPLHSVSADLVPQHRADPGPSIFDLQSETTKELQMHFRPGMLINKI